MEKIAAREQATYTYISYFSLKVITNGLKSKRTLFIM
jgi:hypothetical protein